MASKVCQGVIRKTYVAPHRRLGHDHEVAEAHIVPRISVDNDLIPLTVKPRLVHPKETIFTSKNRSWADSGDEEWDPDFVEWKDGSKTAVKKTNASKSSSHSSSLKRTHPTGKFKNVEADSNTVDLHSYEAADPSLDPATFSSSDVSDSDGMRLKYSKRRGVNDINTFVSRKSKVCRPANKSLEPTTLGRITNLKNQNRTVSKPISTAKICRIKKPHVDTRSVSSPAIVFSGDNQKLKPVGKVSSKGIKYSDSLVIFRDQNGNVSFLEKVGTSAQLSDMAEVHLSVLESSRHREIPIWFDEDIKKILGGLSTPFSINEAQYKILTAYRKFLIQRRVHRHNNYLSAMRNFRKVALVLRKERYPGMVDLRGIQCTRWHEESLARAKDLRIVKKGILCLDDVLYGGLKSE